MDAMTNIRINKQLRDEIDGLTAKCRGLESEIERLRTELSKCTMDYAVAAGDNIIINELRDKLKIYEESLVGIEQEYWSCRHSDLEHGLKSLNEKAAYEFARKYRSLHGFGAFLNATIDKIRSE